MSFRRRLTVFFVLIVVLPMVAVAVLFATDGIYGWTVLHGGYDNTTGLLSNGYGGPGHKDNVSGISGLQNYGYRLFTPDEFFSETVRQDINRFVGSGTVNYRPNSWLSSRLIVGIDFTSRVDEDLCRRDECVAFSDFKEGFKEENRTTFHDYTVDANLTASYGLPQLLGARARTTGGVQYFKNIFARNGAFGEHFAPGSSTITPAAIVQADEAFTGTKTLGAFVEQHFSWNDRLFITGALRMDDNSAFGKDFSAVYYPKFSASWVVSQEPFFPVVGWLANLRLRGAIGASGRQPNSTDALTFFSPTARDHSRSEILRSIGTSTSRRRSTRKRRRGRGSRSTSTGCRCSEESSWSRTPSTTCSRGRTSGRSGFSTGAPRGSGGTTCRASASSGAVRVRKYERREASAKSSRRPAGSRR